MSCAQQTPEERRRGGGPSGEGGDGAIPYVIDHSIHTHSSHLPSASSVMFPAPSNLDSVCVLPLKRNTVLWSSSQETCAPPALCLLVHRQSSELILLHRTALRSSCLEVKCSGCHGFLQTHHHPPPGSKAVPCGLCRGGRVGVCGLKKNIYDSTDICASLCLWATPGWVTLYCTAP